MLIHSKRLANMQGVFYMSFKQLNKATGIFDQALQSQMKKLIEIGIVEKVKSGKKEHRPNYYKVNLKVEVSENVFTTESDNNFKECVLNFYTDKQLKGMFTRRQYDSLIAV